MIIDKNGRTRSVRTKEETEASLAKDLKSLSPDEREALQIMLAEMKEARDSDYGEVETVGQQPLIKVVQNAEYKWDPVDIRTFVMDPYYLGATCQSIYPTLLEDMIELFEGGYHECVLTGSIGWGKTYFASIGICRMLYEISCLRDPHASFGLAKNTDISVVCLSVNENLATKVVFENITNKIKDSPYFQDNFPFQITKKEMRFPNHVWVSPRSTTDTNVLGLNAIGGMLDETNFMTKNRHQKASHARWGHYDKADNLYNAIKRRMKSRFERQGKLPGILFIVSSKKTTEDFTAKRIKDAHNDPSVFVRDYATWDVKPDSYLSGAKRFWVLCGNESLLSKILTDKDAAALQENLPEGAVMIHVPEDYRVDFERDLEGAIRDMAGVATVAVSPFIQRRDKLTFDPTRQHPFTSMEFDPSKPGTFLWDRMVKLQKDRPFEGGQMRERPILNPNAPRHIHIDPSLSGDATGFCVAHIGGYKDVQRRAEDGRIYVERAPIYVVDVVLRIVPPMGDEIILGDVRRLVYDLSAHGYLITTVTLDSFQSADAIQTLSSKGYNAERLSVDTKMDPYENLKTAFYEGRVLVYDYPPLFQELRQLEKDMTKMKVDHPASGSKDVSDAMAGCLYTLSQKAVLGMPVAAMLHGEGTPDGTMWMEEQQQSALAGNGNASSSTMLSPMLSGSGDDDWSGGWRPGSL